MEWLKYKNNKKKRDYILFKTNIKTTKGREIRVKNNEYEIGRFLEYDRQALEVYNGGLIKLFIDIDIPIELTSINNEKYCQKKRIKLIKKYREDGWIIVEFSRRIKKMIKLSYHLIHPNIGFKNCIDMKLYVKEKYNYEGIDFGIYKSYFCLRAPNQSKWCEKNERKITVDKKKVYFCLITSNIEWIIERIDLPILNKNKKIIFKKKINSCMIKDLLNILPSKYYDEYEFWLKICFALKSLGDDSLLDIFNDFSRKSSKYKNYNDVCNQWRNVRNNGETLITINTLFWFAKKSNESEFHKIIDKYNEKNPILNVKTNNNFQDFCRKWNRKTINDNFFEELRCVMGYLNNGTSTYIFKCYDEIKFSKDSKSLKDYILYNKKGKIITFYQAIKLYGFDKLLYDKITFDPSDNVKKNIFNMWSGFKSIKISSPDNKLIKPILLHIKEVLANNNKVFFEYIINWLACLIQRPEIKNGTVLVFVGKQGCGKGIFGKFLAEYLIGEKYSSIIPNIDKITGRFNSILKNKLLIILDEISNIKKEYHKTFDIMKNLITDNRRIIENKGIDPIEVDDFCNYIMFTNNYYPVRCEGGDRRYCIIECGGKYIGNKKYFDNLVNSFNEESANVFHTFLSKIKIDDINLEKMPISDLKITLIENSLPKIIWFIRDIIDNKYNNIISDKHKIYIEEWDNSGVIIENNGDLWMNNENIWFLFNYYCRKNSIKNNKNKIGFSREMNRYLKRNRHKINNVQYRGFIFNLEFFTKNVEVRHGYKIY
jgi:hypothetical protein